MIEKEEREDDLKGDLRRELSNAQKYLDLVGVILVALDPLENIVLINKKGCEILGCDEEDIVGKNWFDTFTPEDRREGAKALFKEQVAQEIGAVSSFEDLVLTMSGEKKLVSWQNNVITDDEGSTIGILLSGEDVTEQKRIEDNFYRLSCAIESTSDAIGMADVTGRSIYHNRAFVDLFEYTPEELNSAGGPAAVYKDPDDMKDVFETIIGEGSWDGELEMNSRSGRKLTVLLRSSAIKDENGNIIGLIGIHTDITKRKQEEELLNESKERSSILVNYSPDGIILMQGGKVIFGNSVFFEMMDFEESEIVNKNLMKLVSRDLKDIMSLLLEDEIKRILKNISDGIKEKATNQTYQLHLKKRSGEIFWVEVSTSPIEYNGRPAEIAFIRDITERRRVEEARRESEERYRLLANNLNDIIWSMDLKLQIDYMSPSSIKLFGISPEESIGKSMMNIMPKESSQSMLNGIKKNPDLFKVMMDLLSGRIDSVELAKKSYVLSKPLEYEFTRPDGEKFFVESAMSLVYDPDGSVVGICGITRDITEKKRAEYGLTQLKEKYRLLIENSPDLISQIDKKGTFITANTKTAEFMGVPMDELIGANIAEVLPKDFLKRGFEILTKLIKSNQAEHFEEYLNGRHLHLIFTPMDIPGQERTFQLIAHDVTEYKKAEEEIKSGKKRLEDILESMTDGVSIVALRGKLSITYVNEAFSSMIGCAREVLIGANPLGDLVGKEDLSKAIEQLRKIRSGDEDETIELMVRRKDGSKFPAYFGMSVLNDAEGKPESLIVVVRDITELKKTEKELKETLADLRSSTKELEQFTFIASHDLQEPLRMVASYVQLLSMRYKDKIDPDADEYIEFAVEGVKRMKGMVDDLMAYSSVVTQGRPFAQIGCEKILDRVLSRLTTVIEENNAVITHDPLPTVMADEWQIISLFQNFIENGIKYRGDELPNIHISAEEKEDEIIFKVRDNGVGIEPENKDKIFQIFSRMNKKRSGTGIGLAICKRIVQRHGGRIWVESEPGDGSTFYFTMTLKGGGKGE
ncbi:MAG: PAS domain S-box protein [Halobacteriota archaeon]|nr:PAS domain S-box protein [Halobacteriota archaeon]